MAASHRPPKPPEIIQCIYAFGGGARCRRSTEQSVFIHWRLRRNLFVPSYSELCVLNEFGVGAAVVGCAGFFSGGGEGGLRRGFFFMLDLLRWGLQWREEQEQAAACPRESMA